MERTLILRPNFIASSFFRSSVQAGRGVSAWKFGREPLSDVEAGSRGTAVGGAGFTRPAPIIPKYVKKTWPGTAGERCSHVRPYPGPARDSWALARRRLLRSAFPPQPCRAGHTSRDEHGCSQRRAFQDPPIGSQQVCVTARRYAHTLIRAGAGRRRSSAFCSSAWTIKTASTSSARTRS
jgi:hypothetical protein